MEASTSGQGTSNIHLDLKCKVCEREFSADVQPRMLPCLHTVCAQCLANVTNNTALASGQQGIMAGSGVVIAKCPICKDDIRSIDDIVEDTWTVPMATAHSISGGEMLCHNCDANVPATNFCVDCPGGLCDPCVVLHRKVRFLRDHVIQPRSEENTVTNSIQPPFCTIHPKERLQLYCEKCVRLTCRDCQLVSHKDHSYQFLTDAAASQRLTMRHFIQELQNKRKNAKVMKSNIQIIFKKMKDQEAIILSRIDEVFNRIRSVIDGQATALKTKIQNDTDIKCRSLKQQLVEVGTVDSALSQCYRVIHNIMTSENDVAALQQNRLVKRRVDLVLRTLLTRQPVTELSLQFKPTNIPSLDAFKRIGSIESMENKVVLGPPGQQQMRPNQGFPQNMQQGMAMNRASLVQQQAQLQAQQQQQVHMQQQQLQQQQVINQQSINLFGQRPMGELARVNRSTVRAPLVHIPRQLQAQQQQQQVRPAMHTNILPVLTNQQNTMGINPSTPTQLTHGLPTAIQPVGNTGPPNVTVTRAMTFGDLATAQMMLGAQVKQMNPQQGVPSRNSPQLANNRSPPSVSPSAAAAVRNTNSASPSSMIATAVRNTNSASPSSMIAPADDNSGPRILSVKSERRPFKSDSERSSCRFPNQSNGSTMIGNGLQDTQPSSSGLEMQQGSDKTSPALDVQMCGEPDRPDQQMGKTPPLSSASKSPAALEDILGIDLPVQVNASDIIGDIMDEVEQETRDSGESGDKSDPAPAEESASEETSGSVAEASGDGAGSVAKASATGSGAITPGESSSSDPGEGSSGDPGQGSSRDPGDAGASGSGATRAAGSEDVEKHIKEKQSGIQVFLSEMDDSMHGATKESIAAFWEGNVSWEERDDQGKPRVQVIVGSLYRMTSKKYSLEGWPSNLHIKMMNSEMLKPLIDLMRDHQLFFLKCDQECKELYRKLVAIFKNRNVFGAIRLFTKPEIILLLFYSHKHQKFYIVCPQQREQFAISFVKTMEKYFPKVQPKGVSDKPNQESSTVSTADGDSVTSETAPSTAEKRPVDEEVPSTSGAGVSRNGGESIEPIPTWKQGYKLRNGMQCARSDDPNDDWCAVCNNGGNLVCCDRCPRVYHHDCHVPVIIEVPEDDFECTLCFDVVADEEVDSNDENAEKLEGFTAREFKLCQRLLLEMYCLEDSQPFLEPVGPEFLGYHESIPIPMDLSTIKSKLSLDSSDKYFSPRQMVDDLRVMFTNCYQYNGETSDLGKIAQHLQRYASRFMKRYLPEYMDSNFVSSANQRHEDRPSKRRKQEHPTPVFHIR